MYVHHTWDDDQWLEAFRMTWATFWHLLEQLCLHLEQQDTNMWPPLPVDTRLAIALVKLAMPTSLCYVGHLFSVGKATTRKTILELIFANLERNSWV
ncbi:hypothetical protein Y1Q_0007497 [Alligator mississippiensis]|uniref:Uncharacterized protein n=1 Tax=Alligator mississippiensis TaxID=8496 RepID=A0A151M522_ALLMI|nr:hypothetical protein Y1Q_0007497 [Alligator mississippiensis]